MVYVKVVLLLALFVVESLVLIRIGVGLDSNSLNSLAIGFDGFLSLVGLVGSIVVLNIFLPTEPQAIPLRKKRRRG